MGGAYSIRVVAAKTGIPAETLRIWERRYGFPKPARRPGGGRLYADADIARLRLIARARDAGYRPGDIIPLPDRDIARLVEDQDTGPRPPPPALGPDIAWLVDALRRDEVARVRAALRSLAITLSPRAFVTEVAHPFAIHVGDAWEAGTLDVRHEHLGTALLSAQLRVLLCAFEDSEDPPTVLLATLPGEAHALGLEMVAVYLATHRATPRLLGADTPPDQIARAARSLKAQVVGVSVSAAHEGALTRGNLDRLRRMLERTSAELWVGGAGAERVAAPAERVRLTTSWSEIDRALAAVRAR
ncbi:MAG: MerR family transcriptional regulator [Phycisphaerales bacterium]|nr:MerR family transcriptional regulator [Phycisphaerales bacterium]